MGPSVEKLFKVADCSGRVTKCLGLPGWIPICVCLGMDYGLASDFDFRKWSAIINDYSKGSQRGLHTSTLNFQLLHSRVWSVWADVLNRNFTWFGCKRLVQYLLSGLGREGWEGQWPFASGSGWGRRDPAAPGAPGLLLAVQKLPRSWWVSAAWDTGLR